MSDASPPERASLPGLALGALGIVFGDIATSPLYALQEAFGAHGVAPTAENVLGVLSLTLWSLLLIVSLKYIVFIMRADNRGEGGSMALLALARQAARGNARLIALVVMLGLIGVALFFGDSVITPAISVLSAVEGLEIATATFKPFVIPLTLAILLVLFALQRFGTARVGALFGPVMAVWLVAIAMLGLVAIVLEPSILAAVNPYHGIVYFYRNGFAGFASLGAVVLVLTGAEALYADMGHFGAAPIRAAWFGLTLPALLLNYFGQGALLLRDPAAAAMPFYHLVPDWALYPIVALACVATVIASQAAISGTYTMVREAVQLGYLPRMRVLQTSAQIRGQIYLPALNGVLLVLVLAAVLVFRSSSGLAAAFGIAVSGTMLISTLLVLVVARRFWQWAPMPLAAFAAVFVTIDLAYFGANALKVESGGWFPLVLGLVALVLMRTWHRGRELTSIQSRNATMSLETFVEAIMGHPPQRVPGAAVFLTSNPDCVPKALLHNLKHNKVLHERNVILTTQILDEPRAPSDGRIDILPYGEGLFRVLLRFGFAQPIDLPAVLAQPQFDALSLLPMETTYFASIDNVVATDLPGMALWRDKLFAFLSANAQHMTEYFAIPSGQLVEIGARVDI